MKKKEKKMLFSRQINFGKLEKRKIVIFKKLFDFQTALKLSNILIVQDIFR